jgi:hypothetical protein
VGVVRTWVWHAAVSQGLLGDRSAYAAHLPVLEAEARAAAAAAGVELGRPTTMRVHPQVWVERWSKDGGAYVAPAVARMANAVGEPAGALVVFEWPIVEPAVDPAVDPAGELELPAAGGPGELPGAEKFDHGAPGAPAQLRPAGLESALFEGGPGLEGLAPRLPL